MYQATPPTAAAPRPAQRRVLDELLGASVEYFRKPELLNVEALFWVTERAVRREEERTDERKAEENMVRQQTGLRVGERPVDKTPRVPLAVLNHPGISPRETSRAIIS